MTTNIKPPSGKLQRHSEKKADAGLVHINLLDVNYLGPSDRGRDARYRMPPAQIPACAINALGILCRTGLNKRSWHGDQILCLVVNHARPADANDRVAA